MPVQKVAVVTCPNCRTRFQTPILQVLDVRVNPNVKALVLQGLLNVAACPQCGFAAPLALPFIYHDPAKEKALLFLPMDVGANEVERQKVAGQLTRELMDSIPQEERKGYLFQPETFFNFETLIERILELDGVTKEMLERRQAQQRWALELLEQEPEKWEASLAEHADLVDEALFLLLDVFRNQLQAAGEEHPVVEKLTQLVAFLVERTEVGARIQRRNEALRALQANPTRAGLLEALQLAPDDETVTALVQVALPLMDYQFFKDLLRLIEEEKDAERKARLLRMREQVLAAREDIRRAEEELIEARLKLLEDILNAQDRKKMIQSHRSEIDEAFSMVLESQLEGAQKHGYRELYNELMAIVNLLAEMAEESLPPELRLIQRLLEAPNDEAMDRLLEQRAALVTPQFAELLADMVEHYRTEQNTELVARLEQILTRVRARLGTAAATSAPAEPTPPQQKPASDETTTPSGLIIAKR